MGSTRSAIGIAMMLAGLAPSEPAAAAAPPLQGPVRNAPVRTPLPSGVFPGDLPAPMADGRMIGHLPYAEVSRSDLTSAPLGFAQGQPCLVHRDMAADLARMLVAAGRMPGVGTTLRGVSCFRAIAHQRAVFCRSARPGTCGDPVERSRYVAPPGYSEHATGYAIDFGVRPSSGCADVDACIASVPAGRWLIAHAPEYGFEMSFPLGNAQGVTWEPWHWRWVGASINGIGAARARLTFARARTTFPAAPSIGDVSDAWLTAYAPTPVFIAPVLRPPPLIDPASRRGRKVRR
ncbi:M15 family metallopeptidase [Sphingomonas sp. RB3P16]|uniref:M15 family metallopeptidase n=1 Tax=Parasphingomonas frigoris TaxID=3096163 RepID=UPI002FC6A3F7